MTKKTVKNMADLKDSRLLYEKDLPPFGYMLVSIIAILLIAVLIWSLKTKKQSLPWNLSVQKATMKQ